MKAIYYFLGIIILIYEFITLANVKERIRKIKLLHSYKDKNLDELNKEAKSSIAWGFMFVVFSFAWYFVGLFTFQYIFYLYFIVIMIIMSFIFNKIRKYDRLYYYFTIFDALVGIAFVIFAVINSYHLHLTGF